MAKQSKDPGNEFKKVPEKKYKPDKTEKRSKKNELIKVMEYLQSSYDFRYNEFAQKPEYKPRGKDGEYIYLDQRVYDNLLMEIKIDCDVNIAEQDFRSLIGSEKLSEAYDPIREYIFSLPKWDGKDRINEFLRRVQLKDESENRERFNNYFKRWFFSYVAALVYPEAYNENCLVLVGGQGVGKTRFLTRLVPPELRLKYTFTGNFNFHDKDHLEMLGSKILINLDEMATLTRTDIAQLKMAMSLQQISVRRAYGKASVEFYRRASFVGSINEDQFLTDQTGNRRWLPFQVDGIDNDDGVKVSLLYSQALAELKNGYRTWFDIQEIRELELYLDQFRRRPIEEELLLVNFRKPDATDFNLKRVEWMQTSEINAYLTSIEAYNKLNMNETTTKKLGMALKSLKFPKRQVKQEGRDYYVHTWGVMKLDRAGEAIKRNKELNDDKDDELPI